MGTSVRDAESTATGDVGPGRPIAGAVLLGVGLGGFFDGIVLHQLLQWHHMGTSAGFPPDSVENLKLNTLWDGLFHAATWLMTVAGVFLLWNGVRRRHVRWPTSLLAGGMVLGWGLFNTIEGLVNHLLLGIHHVREGDDATAWDLGFIALALIQLGAGAAMARRHRLGGATPG